MEFVQKLNTPGPGISNCLKRLVQIHSANHISSQHKNSSPHQQVHATKGSQPAHQPCLHSWD